MDISQNKKHLEEMKEGAVKLCENSIMILKEIKNFAELETAAKMMKVTLGIFEQFAGIAGAVEFIIYATEGKEPPSMTKEKMDDIRSKMDNTPNTFSFEEIERELREGRKDE